MSRAVIIRETGGAEVLEIEEVKKPHLSAGKILIRQEAIGINFLDTYHRSGIYKLSKLPAILGIEAAGVVEDIGDGVDDFEKGDRVAYTTGPIGAYREHRVIDKKFAIKLPDGIDTHTAAAILAKGLTAHTLCRRAYIIIPDSTVLIHAAAGGVGLMLVQWAKAMGAKVIGTVSSDTKAIVARQFGCDHVINYAEENFVGRVMGITDGEGLPVVFDSVGKTTFTDSLHCLHTFGTLVSYGQSSGPVPDIHVEDLGRQSLYLTRPNLWHYKRSREELILSSGELFEMFLQNKFKVHVHRKFKFDEVVRAHRELEGRKTIGSSILVL